MLATDFMKRRHLFDNGFPVCKATLLTGAQVLLAVSRQSLRRSDAELAASLIRLADSADRVVASLARMGASEIDLLASRQRYSTLFGHAHTIGNPALGEENARLEPRHRRACEEPNPR